jgi:hypothetical protein
MNRTTTTIMALIITVLATPTGSGRGVTSPHMPVAALHKAQEPAPAIERAIETPPEPSVVVIGGTPEQLAVVDMAIERYEAVGLDLPTLTIHLHDVKSQCRGFQGVFNLDGSGHRVDVCNSKPMTVLHELAHLWEHHNVNDGQRQALMDLHGVTEWSSLDEDWTDRGIEIAAEVIAGGLLELPLVRAQLEDAPLKAESFRIITGLESPRFEEGLARLVVGA